MAKKPSYKRIDDKVTELGEKIVTQHHQPQQLMNDEERCKLLLMSSPDAIVLFDPVTTLPVEFNEAVTELLGYSREEFAELQISDYEVPESIGETKAYIESILSFGKGEFETKYRTKSGNIVDILVRMRVIDFSGRKFLNSIFRDITKRKSAEKALRKAKDELERRIEERTKELKEERDRAKNYLDTAGVIMVVLDREDRVIRINKKGCEILGWSEEEILEKDWFGNFIPERMRDEVREDCHKSITGDLTSGKYYEKRILTKGPEEKVVSWHTTVLKDEEGRFYASLSSGLDITERVRMEELLKRTNQELTKEYTQRRILSRKLIDFIEQERHRIAMELHDQIGQALTSLKLNLEIVSDRLCSDNGIRPQIVSAINRASQILKDVKSISYGLRPRMLEALGLVSSLLELFDEIEDATGLQVKFFYQNIPKHFDHEKELNLYRIVQESMHNILKHSKAENVYVNLCKKPNAVSLSVEDDGIGFDQGCVMDISKRNIPLGISIMHERTAQLEGDFTIESQVGKGTQVLVEIPLNIEH